MSKDGFACAAQALPQRLRGVCAACHSVFFKIDSIYPFDPPAAEHSLFDIRFFKVSFPIKLAAFQASGDTET
jgi:hypothetical protein